MRSLTRTPDHVAVLPVDWWRSALSSAEAAPEQPPEWAALVEAALARAPRIGATVTVADGATGDQHLVAPLLPFVEVATARLDAAVAGRVCDVDLDRVRARFAEWLGTRLARAAARTLIAELRADRDAGRLRGATAADRFTDFVRSAGGRARLTDLVARHRALGRLLGEISLRAATAVAELLVRFTADRAALVADLLGADPGAVTDLVLGAGDPHDGGRSVALVTFADGSRVVYRPRPVGLQARFAEMLRVLAEWDESLSLRGTRVVVRAGYGWAEFVPRTPCATRADVERFYRRQGALLALLYALDATDVHYENLVACGDEPVVVDVETLLHPAWTPTTHAGDDPALAALHSSVARTALLPSTMPGEHGLLDVSAFGAGADAELPDDVPVWLEAGTDAMRLEPARVALPAASNRPLLGDREVDPAQYGDSLLAGFRAGYDALVAHAAELTAPDGPLAALAAEEIRLVVRHTSAYAILLAEATRPEALVDGAARERAFASLAATDGQPHLAALAPYEIAALRSGDIPLFTARADSTDVRPAGGGLLPGLLPGLLHRSGIDAVRAKVARLGAVDRREQEWVVEATLATRGARTHHRDGVSDPTPVTGAVPDAQHVLSLARGIGDELVARSWQDGARANWLGLEALDGRFWSLLPMGAGLADGYCGTALFLAELGAVSGVGRFTDLAAKAVSGVPRLLDVLRRHPELAREVGSGAFAGFGGIAYALARLATLLDDDGLAASLPAAVEVTTLADVPGRPAVEDGTAGAVAALLAVHAESGYAGAAEAAARLAERLPDLTPDAAGFARGSSGVRWARARYALASGAGAPRIEPPAPLRGLAWCSGATGEMLAALDTGGLDIEAPAVDAYVDAVAQRHPSDDHSLCHGDLGALDALVELALAGHSGAHRASILATARLVGAIERHGARCGTPRTVPSPGLLLGTAGIGYGLLRLAFPNRVPSVLLLRPARAPLSELTLGSRGDNDVRHAAQHAR